MIFGFSYQFVFQLDDKQPLAYLSEMRQVSILFMNLVLSADQDHTQLMQTVFEIVYSRSRAMHGEYKQITEKKYFAVIS